MLNISTMYRKLFIYNFCMFVYPVHKVIIFSFIASGPFGHIMLLIINLTLIYIITGLMYNIYLQKYNNMFLIDLSIKFNKLITVISVLFYYFINLRNNLIIVFCLPLIFFVLCLLWLVLILPIIGLKGLLYNSLSITVPTLAQLLIVATVSYAYMCYIYKNTYYFISKVFGNKNAKGSNLFSEDMLLAMNPFKFLWIIIVVTLCWYFKPFSIFISYLNLSNQDLDLNKQDSTELSSDKLSSNELDSTTKSLSSLNSSKYRSFMAKCFELLTGKKGHSSHILYVKSYPITTTFDVEYSRTKQSKILNEVVKSRLSTILINSGFKRSINLDHVVSNLSLNSKKLAINHLFSMDSLTEKKVTNQTITKGLDSSYVNKPVCIYTTSDIQVMLDGIEKACLSQQKEGFFSDISEMSKNQYLDLVVKNQAVESTNIMVNMMQAQRVQSEIDTLESTYMEYDPQKRYVSDTPPSRLLKARNGNLYYNMLADWLVNEAGIILSTWSLEEFTQTPVYRKDKITPYRLGIEVGSPIAYELKEFIWKNNIFHEDLHPYIPAIRNYTLSFCEPMVTPPKSSFPAHSNYYKDLALWLMYLIRINDNIMLSYRNSIEGKDSSSYYTFRLLKVDTTNAEYEYHYNFLRDMIDNRKATIGGVRLNHNTKITIELLRGIYNYPLVDDTQVYNAQVKYAEINSSDEIYEQISNLQINNSQVSSVRVFSQVNNNSEINNMQVNFPQINNPEINNPQIDYSVLDPSMYNYPIVNNPEMDPLLYGDMPRDPLLYGDMPIDPLLYDNTLLDDWINDPANRLP